MPEPRDMVIPMLQEMREDIRSGFAAVDQRLAKIEQAQESFKQALSADTLLSRLVMGDYEQRIASLEKQMKKLQALRVR